MSGAADKLQGDVAGVHEIVVTPFPLSSEKQESETEPLDSIHLKSNSGDVVADGSSLVSDSCVPFHFEASFKERCSVTPSVRLDVIAIIG